MALMERTTVARTGAVVAAVAGGVAVAIAPLPTVAAVVATVAMIWLLGRGAGVTRVFLGGLAIILAGYALFNRAFAYIGVAPLYVGELILAIGALAFIYNLRRWRLTPLTALILLFMGWGLLQTVPYLPRDGFDAIRDAVAWIYAAFALFLFTILRPEQMPDVVRLVRRLIPYVIVWLPIALLTAIAVGERLPVVPGSAVPIITAKGGDMGVILAGVAAFILVGLYARAEPKPRFPEPLPWIPWLLGAGVVSITNRGGLVAMAMVGAVLVFIRQSSRWLSLFFIVALLFVVGTLVDPRIDIGGRREFSFHQLTDNVTSIFVETDDNLGGTRNFRLEWWGAIVDYTINGPYFWTGKGYGVALAVSDGFDVTEAEELRSPHNGHMEFLARSGVPGLVLWLALQAAFAISMLRAAARARATGRTFWVQVIGWLFVMWLAGLANATFDPYLQGPQGGIWFWSVFGLGLVAIRAVHEDAPDPWADAPPQPDQARQPSSPPVAVTGRA